MKTIMWEWSRYLLRPTRNNEHRRRVTTRATMVIFFFISNTTPSFIEMLKWSGWQELNLRHTDWDLLLYTELHPHEKTGIGDGSRTHTGLCPTVFKTVMSAIPSPRQREKSVITGYIQVYIYMDNHMLTRYEKWVIECYRFTYLVS